MSSTRGMIGCDYVWTTINLTNSQSRINISLLQIDDQSDQLRGATIFSKIDPNIPIKINPNIPII
jgi:hypothetical protein